MCGIDFCDDWKFKETNKLQGIHMNQFPDDSWDNIDLPHDWSIRKSHDKEMGDGCTGYLTGGTAWYRKHFVTTKEMENKLVKINFDGIYNRASIYCNGNFITFHPYGYSPCLVDISKYLNKVGQDNVIAVMVDRTRYADSRWYTGSGIYRKVSMHILPKLHIPIWGTFITTEEVIDNKAKIKVKVQVENEMSRSVSSQLRLTLISPDNQIISEKQVDFTLGNKQAKDLTLDFIVNDPQLWGILDGKQYTAKLELMQEGFTVQTTESKFGIRTFYFDPNKGFFINGEHTLIKGVCLHHDAGLVGAAVPRDVWRRRLEILIEGGCNAVRTAHNPASKDFLDLCDELGLFVQEEFYDEWDNPKDKRYNGNEKKVDYITRGHAEFFQEYAKFDLQNVMKRDRNHPCIFQWSIGNEIEWTYPKYNLATGYFGANASGNYFWDPVPNSKEKIRENIQQLPEEKYEIGKTARKLAEWTREMDQTRPVTANCILPSASYESGYVDALDIVGYSYRQVVYEYGHKNYPEKPIMGAENLGQWHEWKHVLEKEYISGIFLWTGIDYIGEAGNTDVWPKKGLGTGLLDQAAFKKPSYYMYKSLWTESPMVHMVTQTLEKSLYILDDLGEPYEKDKNAWKQRLWIWHPVNPHWNYEEDETVIIEVYSNCESVALYVNNQLVSEKFLKDFADRIYKWAIPFQKGEIKAIGKKDGKEVDFKLVTAGQFAKLKITADKDQITTSRDQVVHIVAQLQDLMGNDIKDREEKVEFIIEGPYKLLGVDNGDINNVQDHYAKQIISKNGKCMIILQAQKQGIIKLYAKVNQNISEEIFIRVE